MNSDRKRIRLPLVAGFSLALAGAGFLFAGCSTTSSDSYSSSAGVEIGTVDDFYGPLTPYGEWVVIGSYGRCWRPRHVNRGWRPYSDGSWVHCDAGWYWESDEPWGWATYHYGRWDYDPGFGWYWVPQTRWAPAWVAWRSGGGYVGWAPLRPSARFDVSVHIHDHDAPERDFVFVPERRFVHRVRPHTVIVNNPTVVRQTVNITRIDVRNTTVINEGPRVDAVEKAAGTRVRTTPAAQLRREKEARVVRENPALTRSRTTATTRGNGSANAQRRPTASAPPADNAKRERSRGDERNNDTTPPPSEQRTAAPPPARAENPPPTTPTSRPTPSRSQPKASESRTVKKRPAQRPKAPPADPEKAKTAATPAPATPNAHPDREDEHPKPDRSRARGEPDQDDDEARKEKDGG